MVVEEYSGDQSLTQRDYITIGVSVCHTISEFLNYFLLFLILDDARSVRRVPGPPLHIRDDCSHRDQEEAAARRPAAGAVPQPAPALGAGVQVLQNTR